MTDFYIWAAEVRRIAKRERCAHLLPSNDKLMDLWKEGWSPMQTVFQLKRKDKR